MADETGVPIGLLPPFRHKGKMLEDDEELHQYNIAENDIIEMDPMQVKINVLGTGNVVDLKNLDPFNDTIDDIKRHLDKDLDVMPVEKQRLMRGDEVICNDSEGNDGDDDILSPTLFDCGIQHMDTLDVERFKIDLWILQPNSSRLILENLDRRRDTMQPVEKFLSENYYKGRDKDGTIAEDQLRPLMWDGERLDMKSTKSLLDHGMTTEDVCVITMEPMTVHVNIEARDGKPRRLTINNVDPSNDNIRDLKSHAITSSGYATSSVKKWILLHRESEMKELNAALEKLSFYDNGIQDGDNLVLQRKQPEISIQLPSDISLAKTKDSKGIAKVLPEDGDKGPILVIKVDPERDDFDKLRRYISDFTRFPKYLQKLNKMVGDSDKKKDVLDAVGSSKLSSPELTLIDDTMLELEPPTIHFQSVETGEIVPLEVLPSDTIEDIKKALETVDEIGIPANKQRLMTNDGTEIGGDDEDDAFQMSNFFDTGLVNDGDTVLVEKSKIAVIVEMPNNMSQVEIYVDPKKDSMDDIRKQVSKTSGLPAQYQQRFSFKDQLMDEGYNADGGDSKQPLAGFKLKEFDTITLGATRVIVKVVPENDEFEVENVDPINNTIYDLKQRAYEKTTLPISKFRLIDVKNDKEYDGRKDAKETLDHYGIQDGEVLHVERKKINFRIVLPDLQELSLSVDPRLDDLQKIRDFVFKKYYDGRELPKKALRPMLRGAVQVLDDEPGDKKLKDFGILADNDHVRLKPCPIIIETPKKQIYCTNADPFHDDLHLITKFVKSETGVDIEGCHIEYKGQKLTDYNTVLFDLDIHDEDVIHYVR